MIVLDKQVVVGATFRSRFSYGGMDEKPHSQNLRKGRSSEIGRVYAITKCTVHRSLLFDPGPKAAVAVQGVFDALDLLQSGGVWKNYGCMVMPDHVHFVLKLQDGGLSEGIARFSLLSTQRIHEIVTTRGPVWQDGFYDHALRGERSLNAYLLYMARNPVRAGLVEKAEDWPFQVGILRS